MGLTYHTATYKMYYVQITNENLLHSTGNSMLCADLNGKEILKVGDICTHIADSLCCTAEI